MRQFFNRQKMLTQELCSQTLCGVPLRPYPVLSSCALHYCEITCIAASKGLIVTGDGNGIVKVHVWKRSIHFGEQQVFNARMRVLEVSISPSGAYISICTIMQIFVVALQSDGALRVAVESHHTRKIGGREMGDSYMSWIDSHRVMCCDPVKLTPYCLSINEALYPAYVFCAGDQPTKLGTITVRCFSEEYLYAGCRDGCIVVYKRCGTLRGVFDYCASFSMSCGAIHALHCVHPPTSGMWILSWGSHHRSNKIFFMFQTRDHHLGRIDDNPDLHDCYHEAGSVWLNLNTLAWETLHGLPDFTMSDADGRNCTMEHSWTSSGKHLVVAAMYKGHVYVVFYAVVGHHLCFLQHLVLEDPQCCVVEPHPFLEVIVLGFHTNGALVIDVASGRVLRKHMAPGSEQIACAAFYDPWTLVLGGATGGLHVASWVAMVWDSSVWLRATDFGRIDVGQRYAYDGRSINEVRETNEHRKRDWDMFLEAVRRSDPKSRKARRAV